MLRSSDSWGGMSFKPRVGTNIAFPGLMVFFTDQLPHLEFELEDSLLYGSIVHLRYEKLRNLTRACHLKSFSLVKKMET